MVATATVKEGNGVTVTWTTITNGRFCTADDDNPGLTNPIPIPTAGTKYSYWKNHCLDFSDTFTQITNVKIYTTDLDFGTGTTVNVGDETLAAGSYEQALGTPGDTGTEVITGHTGISAKTDFSTYVTGNRKTVDAGPITSPGVCKHIVLQMDVGTTAVQGQKTPETITWVYDEI